MRNIHLLPTDKPSRLVKLKWFGKDKLHLCKVILPIENEEQYQYLYITSDEEIKEGDFVTNGKYISQAINEWWTKFYIGNPELKADYWKIILSTDPDLIAEGVQPIDDEFLEWFVKNPSCEFIEVRKYHQRGDVSFKDRYRIIIPQESTFINN